MKKIVRKILLFAVVAAMAVPSISAQNSAPAPGSGSIGGGGGGWGGPPAWGPGPAAGWWGNPWGPGWNDGYGPYYSPTVVINSNWQNQGKTNVVGCGYDASGVWRTIPMSVEYQYTGVEYEVTVLTAWNPWSDSWDTGLNIPAVNTSYYLNGRTYDFYVVLSTGTFYFNL